MKLRLLLSLFCILSLFLTRGQSLQNTSQLKQIINLADSILLISHEVTAEYAAVPDDKPENIAKWDKSHPVLHFLIDGKLNRKIIKEQAILIESSKLDLSQILLRKVNTKKWVPTKCDEPRHSIIIYAKTNMSFIDICFSCRRIHTSKDIHFDEFNMDEKKWIDLEIFFKANGLTKIIKEYNE